MYYKYYYYYYYYALPMNLQHTHLYIIYRRWFPSQLSLEKVEFLLSNYRENSSKVISGKSINI